MHSGNISLVVSLVDPRGYVRERYCAYITHKAHITWIVAVFIIHHMRTIHSLQMLVVLLQKGSIISRSYYYYYRVSYLFPVRKVDDVDLRSLRGNDENNVKADVDFQIAVRCPRRRLNYMSRLSVIIVISVARSRYGAY